MKQIRLQTNRCGITLPLDFGLLQFYFQESTLRITVANPSKVNPLIVALVSRKRKERASFPLFLRNAFLRLRRSGAARFRPLWRRDTSPASVSSVNLKSDDISSIALKYLFLLAPPLKKKSKSFPFFDTAHLFFFKIITTIYRRDDTRRAESGDPDLIPLSEAVTIFLSAEARRRSADSFVHDGCSLNPAAAFPRSGLNTSKALVRGGERGRGSKGRGRSHELRSSFG